MTMRNLSALDRQVCDCQNKRDDWQKEPLVEVKSVHHWERKQKDAKPDNEWGWGMSGIPSHLKAPTTEDDTRIIRENFPDANLVCPVCGEQYVAVVNIMTVEEAQEWGKERRARLRQEQADEYTEMFEDGW